MAMTAAASSSSSKTVINDLPEPILTNIIAAVSDTRSRNAIALTCRKWCLLERSSRTTLSLRGNLLRDLFMLPTCFRSVTHLDLSLVSPWGHPFLSLSSSSDPSLLAHFLRQAFPSVISLTLYARNPPILQMLAPQWPNLKQVKLLRWHQRPQLPHGADLLPLFENCYNITSLDLSSFYCWTDDIAPALELHPDRAAILTKLDLLNPSFAEGFKSNEIKAITSACPNLNQILIACMFDPRYIGFVADDALLAISINCPKLKLLHLADTSAPFSTRGDPDDEGFSNEDAGINAPSLIEFFSGLPLLEELVLDVRKNVAGSGPALEMLNLKCPKLKSLKLGQFHGICAAVESKLDGVALCHGLESLSITSSADLTDMGLIAIGRGCSKLARFEVEGCKKITVRGMRTLASLLHRTLVEVKISCCKNLGAASSLKALEPIQSRIERIHIDCVWDSVEQFEDLDGIEFNFDLNKAQDIGGGGGGNSSFGEFSSDYDDIARTKKKCKYSYDLNMIDNVHINGNGDGNGNGNGFRMKTWNKLKYLSLWIGVGELLSPLSIVGLDECPRLEEMKIKIEGDCREWSRLSERAFGLSSLVRYPELKKMHLDCGDVIGYAHTAPSGQMDLSLWERFYLFGIKNLSLEELDYWPPQDRDVNQRSLSLPAAGLLAECSTLRKLFIHGTAHEHFLMFLLSIPNLRDVQLREDYYPAPADEMSTEMRVDSWRRFEDALNRRHISD